MPTRKVDEIKTGCSVTQEIRKRLLFGEVLTTQLKDTVDKLLKNSKQREAFQKFVSGKKHLNNMGKQCLPKNRNNDHILKSNRRHPTFLIRFVKKYISFLNGMISADCALLRKNKQKR